MTKRHDLPHGRKKFRDARGRFRPMDLMDVAAQIGGKIKIPHPDTVKDVPFGYYIGPSYTPLPTEPDGTVGYVDHIGGFTVKLRPKPRRRKVAK